MNHILALVTRHFRPSPLATRQSGSCHGLLGRGRGERPQGPDDLIGLREAVFRALGEDELAVGDDVELTAGARDDVGVDAERLLD